MAIEKVNLYTADADVKAWVESHLTWEGYFTLRQNKEQSRYELDDAFSGASKLVEGIPTNVAAALVNAAQSGGSTDGRIDKNHQVDGVTFELQVPVRPDYVSPDPRYYPATDAGKRQYLADYGKHLDATRQANESAPPPSLKRWG